MKNIFWDKAHLMFSLIVIVIWAFYIFVVSNLSALSKPEIGVIGYFIHYMTDFSTLLILIIGLIIVYVIITFVLHKKN